METNIQQVIDWSIKTNELAFKNKSKLAYLEKENAGLKEEIKRLLEHCNKRADRDGLDYSNLLKENKELLKRITITLEHINRCGPFADLNIIGTYLIGEEYFLANDDLLPKKISDWLERNRPIDLSRF